MTTFLFQGTETKREVNVIIDLIWSSELGLARQRFKLESELQTRQESKRIKRK